MRDQEEKEGEFNFINKFFENMEKESLEAPKKRVKLE